MKCFIWILGAVFILFAAGCSLLDPTANQSTIEASNQYGNSCPVVVNLDGSNAVTIANGTYYTFPLATAGSHTLNFSTFNPNPVCASGTNCIFTNNNTASYSTTFDTTGGHVYVGMVKQNGNCNDLVESGP